MRTIAIFVTDLHMAPSEVESMTPSRMGTYARILGELAADRKP